MNDDMTDKTQLQPGQTLLVMVKGYSVIHSSTWGHGIAAR